MLGVLWLVGGVGMIVSKEKSILASSKDCFEQSVWVEGADNGIP